MSEMEASQFRVRFISLILGKQGFPERPLDRHVLLISATLGLEFQREYTERELSEELRTWTARFGDAVDLDHVSLRRYLVDEGYLRRDTAGRCYELTTTGWPYALDPSIRALDLDALVHEARVARELSKQQYLDKSRT